jgi:hypothetical protein
VNDSQVVDLIDECYRDPNLNNDLTKRLLVAILLQVWRPLQGWRPIEEGK